MEIKTGYEYITLPEKIASHSAQLIIYSRSSPEQDPTGHWRVINQISFSEMVEMKAKLPVEAKISGMPSYWAYAIIEEKPRLFFWPAPAQDHYAKFRYCPALKEI